MTVWLRLSETESGLFSKLLRNLMELYDKFLTWIPILSNSILQTKCFGLCINSVNIYVGIRVPCLIDTPYNFIAYGEPLYIENEGLSFSLLVFYSTSVGCSLVLVLRRIAFGGELGGPRHSAWITCYHKRRCH